jgi:MEMO1 family protein
VARPLVFNKIFWLVILGLALAISVSAKLVYQSKKPQPPLTSSVLNEVDGATVESATAVGDKVATQSNPIAAVLPHHILATSLMGEVAGSLRQAKPQTIVIIGPDHGNLGSTRYTISDRAWQSSLGKFNTNDKIIQKLLALPDVSITNPIIAQEHSVLNPMPFLARRFPEARFVLVIVRGGLQTSEEQKLAEKLNEILKSDDLVVASVDFSHYKDLARAQDEDKLSMALLKNNNPQQLEAIPADSPASLFVAMTFAKLRGAGAPTIVNHKNSVDFTNKPNDPSTTSYITAVWGK